MLLIYSADLLDCSASFFISEATTTNPFPASPALAASIEAFRERRLVCSETSLMILRAFEISVVLADKEVKCALEVLLASLILLILCTKLTGCAS